jgi:predicted RNA-binding protein with PUA-like domain
MARHWLMKTEPGTYSIDDLQRDGQTCWEGVRNYQARNLMRDELREGDLVIFYHSNAAPAGAVGLARVCREGYPDPFALDPGSSYHDVRATPEKNPWVMVDVAFVERWADTVALAELKADPALEGMLVVRRGTRLSVQPVQPEHFERVVALGRAKGPARR